MHTYDTRNKGIEVDREISCDGTAWIEEGRPRESLVSDLEKFDFQSASQEGEFLCDDALVEDTESKWPYNHIRRLRESLDCTPEISFVAIGSGEGVGSVQLRYMLHVVLQRASVRRRRGD
mmetsp:Transcript_29781/g.49148  ORF Transcript_29781/g.49148 Transcript_29781/m.49148 type:complete len:120 (+) Transcript_29781:89-448(+)